MNHMKLVNCPVAGAPFWANSCNTRKDGNVIRSDYRCCKCGAKGHEIVKGRG